MNKKIIKGWAVVSKNGKINNDSRRLDISHLKRKAQEIKKWWGEKEDKVVRVEIKIIKQ